MSNIWVRAWRNTPRYDCGLCGRATCSAFARAYLAGDIGIETCPVMKIIDFQNLRATLESMRQTENIVRPHPAPEMGGEDIVFLQPCKDDVARVSGEFRLFNGVSPGEQLRFGGFDPIVLCDLLEAMKNLFTSIRCSKELGYARADREEMNITILQDGRINLRQISSEDRALELAFSLERVLMGALICDCCGCDLLSILSWNGYNVQHPVLKAGKGAKLERTIVEVPLTQDLVKKNLGKFTDEVISIVNNAENKMLTAIKMYLTGERNDFQVDLIDETTAIVDIMLTSEGNTLVTILLKIVALIRVFENAIKAVAELTYESLSNPSRTETIQTYLHKLYQGHLIDIDSITVTQIKVNIARIQHALSKLEIWKTERA